MKQECSSIDKLVEMLRSDYEFYLRIAKSILLGEQVDEELRKIVEEKSLSDSWFYGHCVSPCDFLGVEPDEKMAETLRIYDGDVDDEDDELGDEEDACYDDEFDDDNVNGIGRSKEQIAFGITGGWLDEAAFAVAKSIWNGDPLPVDDAGGMWYLDRGVNALIAAKVKTLEDFHHIVKLLEKSIESYDDDIQEIKTLRWRLADCYYIEDDYEKALSIYSDLLSTEKGFVARPTLACQILNIKIRAGVPIKARDLMMIPKPSDYKLKVAEFKSLMEKSSDFLDAMLDGMTRHGSDIKHILDEAGKHNHPYTCFYMGRETMAILKRLGKKVTFPCIDAESEKLKEILSLLFTEMRFLGNQLKDVTGIEEDWIEETRIYNQVIDVFPHEEIVFHYRTPWLWKFQLSFYLPRLKLAFAYRGRAVQDGKNFTRQSGGKDEYFRLYNRTMAKAEKEYGIRVEVIDEDSSIDSIVASIRSHQ